MLLLATSLQAVAADPPTLSPATTMEQAGMVDIRAVVPGIAQDQFEQIAQGAKAGCPISKLLKAEITLEHSLEA